MFQARIVSLSRPQAAYPRSKAQSLRFRLSNQSRLELLNLLVARAIAEAAVRSTDCLHAYKLSAIPTTRPLLLLLSWGQNGTSTTSGASSSRHPTSSFPSVPQPTRVKTNQQKPTAGNLRLSDQEILSLSVAVLVRRLTPRAASTMTAQQFLTASDGDPVCQRLRLVGAKPVKGKAVCAFC